MDMESCNGQMVLDMKVTGKITMQMGKASLSMQWETFMMVNGLGTKLMGLEPIQALTLEGVTQVIGKTICNMAKELKSGKMTATTKVNSCMEKKVVWVGRDGLMDQFTLVIGKTT